MEVAKETVCRIASPIEEFRLGNLDRNKINIDLEICSIAISTGEYNIRMANLVDHLLILDQKMFETDKAAAGVA